MNEVDHRDFASILMEHDEMAAFLHIKQIAGSEVSCQRRTWPAMRRTSVGKRLKAGYYGVLIGIGLSFAESLECV